MFNNSVIRVFIVPPSFLAYVIVRYRHNLTIKLLPKQEGVGLPTPSILYSAYFVCSST